MNIQDTFFGQIRQCSLSDLRYIKHSLEGLWGLCRAVQRTLNVWWGCGVVGLWGCGVSGVWDLGTLCGGGVLIEVAGSTPQSTLRSVLYVPS